MALVEVDCNCRQPGLGGDCDGSCVQTGKNGRVYQYVRPSNPGECVIGACPDQGLCNRLANCDAWLLQREGNSMDSKYLRPGFDFALAHLIEECGEVLSAAGKTQRWGRDSYNPELPPAERETNEAWLRRELRDLRGAMDRLEAEIIE